MPLVDRVCVARGKVETELGKPVVPDGSGHFELGPLAGPPVTYSVKGTLTKGSASGSVSVSYPTPGCYGSAEITDCGMPNDCATLKPSLARPYPFSMNRL